VETALQSNGLALPPPPEKSPARRDPKGRTDRSGR
jgi:hypothetical protein